MKHNVTYVKWIWNCILVVKTITQNECLWNTLHTLVSKHFSHNLCDIYQATNYSCPFDTVLRMLNDWLLQKKLNHRSERMYVGANEWVTKQLQLRTVHTFIYIYLSNWIWWYGNGLKALYIITVPQCNWLEYFA